MKHFAKWLMLAALVLPVSCSTPAKLAYLRDLEYETPYLAKPAPELRLQVEDKVSIQVFSTDAELAAPFNLGSGTMDGTGKGFVSTSYIVDKLGNIDFPVLGTLHVEGKTVNELKDEISGEIIRLGYIREPIVKVALENFSITVIGETGQSVMPIEGNSINILQVMARSGGTTEHSKIPDVMVIRTEGGERVAHTINLQSKSLFDSPVFYLQQNDIVYVKPRGLRVSSGGSTTIAILSPIMSAATTIAYLLLWSRR